MSEYLLHLKLVLLSVVLFTASACAGPGAEKVLDDIARDPLGGTLISGVPFFPDDEKMCGPAAVASVMGYYGTDVGLEEAAMWVYSEKLEGSLPVDLLIFAKEKGFTARYYEGSLDDIKANLASGRPLILFVNLGLPAYPAGHYVVAIGYNDKYSTVIVHSGMDEKLPISYKRLELAWSMTGHSTLLITPKEPDKADR